MDQDQVTTQTTQMSPVAGAIFGLIWLAVVILMIAALWKVFVKAGKPGWAAIVPIYNVIVLLEIAGKPLWWIVLMFIPLVNFVIAILVAIGIAARFGKGAGFGIGLTLLPFVFYPILGFGSATASGSPSA
jgi:hypothetical protein